MLLLKSTAVIQADSDDPDASVHHPCLRLRAEFVIRSARSLFVYGLPDPGHDRA